METSSQDHPLGQKRQNSKSCPEHHPTFLRLMVEQVAAGLFQDGCQYRPLLLACSGGPDSQALLDMIALCRDRAWTGSSPPLTGPIQVVGMDHGLRPEACKELALARELATQHHLPYRQVALKIPRRGNLLAQARQQRLNTLRQLAAQQPHTLILLGHHLDDQVETILFRMARGTRLQGLGAMRRLQHPILRPLLLYEKKHLLAWLTWRNIPYAIDPSNGELPRARAFLRRYVTPTLKQLHGNVSQSMGTMATWLQQDSDYLEDQARQLLTRHSQHQMNLLCHAWLGQQPPCLARRILNLWLRQQLTPAPLSVKLRNALEQVMLASSPPQGMVQWRTPHHRLIWLEQKLWCLPILSQPLDIHPGRSYPIPLLGGWLEHSAPSASFDPKQLKCLLRYPRAGERLVPLGNHRKRIVCVLAQGQIPAPLRPFWPMLDMPVTQQKYLIGFVQTRRVTSPTLIYPSDGAGSITCHFPASPTMNQVFS